MFFRKPRPKTIYIAGADLRCPRCECKVWDFTGTIVDPHDLGARGYTYTCALCREPLNIYTADDGSRVAEFPDRLKPPPKHPDRHIDDGK